MTATELESLAEYLWQFTVFNNSDYAVQSASTSTSSGSLVETIRMGKLVAGVAGSCDTVEITRLDPHHECRRRHADACAHAGVRSFKVKGKSSGVEACEG